MYSSSFIELWIGEEYRMSAAVVWLMTANMYIILSRTTVEAYLFALGQFQDIYSPIIEGVLNLGLSILLGYLWGLTGILSGVFISLFTMVFLWKPIFLFHWGFKISYWKYVKLYLKHIGAIIISIVIWYLLRETINIKQIHTWNQFITNTFIGCLVFGIVLFINMLLFRCEFYRSIKRIIHIK